MGRDALYRRCDKCGVYEEATDPDDPPDGWQVLSIGVRGTADATNRHGERYDVLICNGCDDALYAWFYNRGAG